MNAHVIMGYISLILFTCTRSSMRIRRFKYTYNIRDMEN